MGRKVKSRVKSLRGVEAYRAKDGAVTVYIRYSADGKPYREWVGPSKLDAAGRDETIIKARRLLAERRAEIQEAKLHEVPWLSPKEREKRAGEQASVAQDARAVLLFEKASERFLEKCAHLYSDPKGKRGQFKRLSIFFGGRYLD